MAIMLDLQPILRTIYLYYFEEELMTLQKTKDKLILSDLRKQSLDSCFQFLKDFELCPLVLHKKTCFALWYNIQETIGSPHEV